jgi:hypothetical protein
MNYSADNCDRHLTIRHEHLNSSSAFGRFTGVSAAQEFLVTLAKTPIVLGVRSDNLAKITPLHTKSSNWLSYFME